MSEQSFERPILNSPYEYPGHHWELVEGQPTNRIIEARRRSDLVNRHGRRSDQGGDHRNAGRQAELCRVVEAYPRVRSYVQNQNLGLEVPYLMDSVPRRYIPDFIVQIDDGRLDPLNLVIEIKGFPGEDAKEKTNTMRAGCRA